MSTTISYAGGITIRPVFAVSGTGDVEITSRTITHDILDGAPVHTLRPARPRQGTLKLLFDSSTASHTAANALSAPAVYIVESDDDPTINMLRMIVRRISTEQQADADGLWLLSVDYESVV